MGLDTPGTSQRAQETAVCGKDPKLGFAAEPTVNNYNSGSSASSSSSPLEPEKGDTLAGLGHTPVLLFLHVSGTQKVEDISSRHVQSNIVFPKWNSSSEFSRAAP